MMPSMTIFECAEWRKGKSSVHISGQLSILTPASGYFLDLSSMDGQHGEKGVGLPLESCIDRVFGLFRKIHILESRLMHRPTNRMILTSLELVANR